MCTSLAIGDPACGVFYARTLEFTLQINSEILVIPAGTELTATDRNGKFGRGGLTWTTSRGVIGMTAVGLNGMVDGLNDAGLAIGELNFTKSARFMDVSDADQEKSVSSFELAMYLLTTCATVEDVKAALPGLLVQGVALAEYGGQVPLVHYTVHDRTGACALVEYTASGLTIYDNPTRICTNEPPFPYHIQNLGQYRGISNAVPKPLELPGLTIKAVSSGDATFGLPGDNTAYARFVRAFFYSRFATPHATPDEGFDTARHLIHAFDIPPGTVQNDPTSGEGGGVAGAEITEWSVVYDLSNAVFNVNYFDDPAWFRLDVEKACAAAIGPTLVNRPAGPSVVELSPA